MRLGVNMRNLIIPPLTTDVQFADICNTETCRSRNNPLDPVVTKPFIAFAAGLHMHEVGKQIYTEHFRRNRKMGELGREDSYDFNMQRIIVFDQPIGIQPGDVLMTHCIYDNSLQNRTIMGG